MKTFFCDCTNPDYETLGISDANEFSDLIDEAKEITKEEFLENCEIPEETKELLKRFPDDFDFFRNGDIYFFTHSWIEHFFK